MCQIRIHHKLTLLLYQGSLGWVALTNQFGEYTTLFTNHRPTTSIIMWWGITNGITYSAAGAVAAKLLAPNLSNADDNEDDGDGGCIGIVGTGIQARYQLRYLKYITTCRKVLIYGRTVVNVQTFITDMTQEGWNISSVSNVDDLLQYCTLIVTTTCAREPYLGKVDG